MSAQEPNSAAGVAGERLDAESIEITAKAAQRVKDLLSREGREGEGLRVWVRCGCCSGLSYALDLAPRTSAGDLVLAWLGVAGFGARAAVSYLTGTDMCCAEGRHNAGFRFSTTRATRTCGGGESFSV